MSVVIIPIINKEVTLLQGAPIDLGDNVFIENMGMEFWGHLNSDTIRIDPEFSSLLAKNPNKCIRIILKDDFKEELLLAKVSALAFLLNYYSDQALALRFAAVFDGVKKLKITKCIPLTWGVFSHAAKSNKFKIRSGTKRSELKNFYTVIQKAVAKEKKLSIILNRFNSSLLRQNADDKIIDLTISMESIINASTEINFKFSTIHSYLYSSDPAKRPETLNKLKKLYQARSNIVHTGNTTTKAVKEVLEEIDEFVSIGKTSIGYYIFYLWSGAANRWDNHLTELILGKNIRITE